MTLYLYGGPKTRVSMPKWYMAEKGISYEYVNVDLAARQNLAPSYLEVNPFGKLPALKDDSNGLVLTLDEVVVRVGATTSTRTP